MTEHEDIKHRTVMIKALMVDNRKMPLSVYKQLRCAPLIKHDGSLAGDPWGTVNIPSGEHTCYSNPRARGALYGPKTNTPSGTRHNVVWELNGELRRDHITRAADFVSYSAESGTRYIDTLILHYLIRGDFPRGEWSGAIREHLASDNGDQHAGVQHRNMHVNLGVSDIGYRAWLDSAPPTLMQHLGVEGSDASLAEAIASAHGALMGELDTEADRRTAIRAAHAAVVDLPQLYIGA